MRLALWLIAFSLAFIPISLAQSGSDLKSGDKRIQTEIYRDGTVTLLSDYQEAVSDTRLSAKGHVLITYKDTQIEGDEADYDVVNKKGSIKGKVRFSQKDQWLTCSRAEFDFASETGAFYDASGYTDRQFSISGRTILKTGPDTYKVEDPFVTACNLNKPKWSFQAGRANIRIDRTARLHNTVFKVKGIPVFYAPYLILPMEKKARSSGLLPFHTGTSTSKGRVFSEGYYQTLGQSADVRIYGDYFTLRGLAIGGEFRARPNPETRFDLRAYGIKDKLHQGGVQLEVDGESQLRDDWRAVARVNISSNFSFRQAFADSFRSATVSQEKATAFLTRDHQSISTNIAFERQEVVFPVRSLVIRKVPSLEFLSLGTPLGHTPFILSFRTSLDGMSRADSMMQTQRLTQRLDFYPRLTLRVPALKGFSFIPSVGVRETYYGAQLSGDTENGVMNSSLHRRYAEVSVEMKTPVLERDFSSSWFGDMRHSIEPYVNYRWIHGIRDFEKVIRFDEQDAIADTNEIEYGIVNRFMKGRKNAEGFVENHEFMSFALIQKYYFDPTFGGAFKAGESNSFYPLDTVTGFYQTKTPESLAPLSAVFQLSPRNGIHNDLRVDFDARRQSLRNESLSTIWQQGRFGLSGTYVRTHATEPGMISYNHVQGGLSWGSPNRGLAANLAISYNLRTSQLLNSNTSVSYFWDCCGISMEFNQYDLGLRTESRFSFSFSLKGIGSFGNMKRPENPF